MFSEFHTGLLTYLKFTFGLPKKLTEGTDLSIALSNKNAFHFSFKTFVLLIVSVLQPIESHLFININQQHMHFVGTKKKVIQSTSATEGAQPLLNRNKKELITTACEQLSST